MINDLEDGVDWLAGRALRTQARVRDGIVLWRLCGDVGGDPQPRPLSLRDQLGGADGPAPMLRHAERGFAARRYFRAFERQIIGDPPTDLTAISPARDAKRCGCRP
jgi:hypothetical protein